MCLCGADSFKSPKCDCKFQHFAFIIRNVTALKVAVIIRNVTAKC